MAAGVLESDTVKKFQVLSNTGKCLKMHPQWSPSSIVNSWSAGMTDWIPGGATAGIRLLVGMAGARWILGLVSAFWWMRLGPRTSSSPLLDRTMSCIDFLQGAWAVPEQLFVHLWVGPDPGLSDGQGPNETQRFGRTPATGLLMVASVSPHSGLLGLRCPRSGIEWLLGQSDKLEGFQNGISSTSELVVERATQNCCYQCLHPQDTPLCFTHLGEALRPRNGSEPGFFSVYFFCPGSLSMWDSGCSL